MSGTPITDIVWRGKRIADMDRDELLALVVSLITELGSKR
jgi:hypothetical protein